MNHHSRQIKNNVAETLKLTTVDTPVFGWQKKQKGTGKGLIDVMNKGTRGSIHQGHSVTNFGSYLPDPRGANKGPSSGSYMRRVAKQKRDQYEGPYLLSNQVNDYRAIGSEITSKMKTEGVRRYAFRREELEDTIALAARKLPTTHHREEPGIFDVEREANRVHERVNPYELRSDFAHHEVKGQSDRLLKNNTTKLTQRYSPDNLIPDLSVRNIQSINPKSFDRQTYRRINPLDLISDIPSQPLSYLGNSKNGASYTHINAINLVERSLRDFEENKIPFSKSVFLTNKQKALINDYLKSGLSERDLLNVLYKTGQDIKKQGLVKNDFVANDILATLVDQRTKGWTPTQKMQLLHIYTVESPPTTINQVKRNEVTQHVLENNWVKNEEEIYDDLGRLQNRPTFSRSNTWVPGTEQKPTKLNPVISPISSKNYRPDYVYPTNNKSFTQSITRGNKLVF